MVPYIELLSRFAPGY